MAKAMVARARDPNRARDPAMERPAPLMMGVEVELAPEPVEEVLMVDRVEEAEPLPVVTAVPLVMTEVVGTAA